MLPPPHSAAALIALLTAACAVPHEGIIGEGFCNQAELGGTLVPDDQRGLAVRGGAEVKLVEWPQGWEIRDVFGEWHLFDETGRDIGTEGDRISMGGGFSSGPNEVFQPCGPFRVEPGP